MILPLFLRISEICSLLIPCSVDKLALFTNGKIIIIIVIVCLSFMERILITEILWIGWISSYAETGLCSSNHAVWANENYFTQRQSKSGPIRTQWNVLVTPKGVQICLMKQNKFNLHRSCITWFEEKCFSHKIWLINIHSKIWIIKKSGYLRFDCRMFLLWFSIDVALPLKFSGLAVKELK